MTGASRVVSIALLICTAAFAENRSLVVHEWGTFTSLQDETGRTIGGINSDDEPLPTFVHDLLGSRRNVVYLGKGLPGGTRQEVTMRLETPVMYFHSAPGAAPQTIDVDVQFHGGLLSQFYPAAITNIQVDKIFPSISNDTLGTLTWHNVQIGTDGTGPKTDAHVWLAPRNVAAANVTANNGESERYLFYRGVGHIDAPIIATRDGSQLTFQLRSSTSLPIERLWLAKFDSDGICHAVILPKLEWTGVSAPIPNNRRNDDLNLCALRDSMKRSLVSAGLFDDEADAMLSTWEKSYFKSAGLRLFYVVPREWTDQVLPLHVSRDAKVERVMIGRLEIVSPEQREALLRIENMDNISNQMKLAWDSYASLGRFRTALLIDEYSRHGTSGLRQFVNLYGIE